MLINIRSRLQRVCVTTKGKARRKRVSARSINFRFIYLYNSHSRAQMEEFYWYWVVERCRWQSHIFVLAGPNVIRVPRAYSEGGMTDQLCY
jgi:hypothetical protein